MRRPPLRMLMLAGVMAASFASPANADLDRRSCYDVYVEATGIPPLTTVCTLLTR